MEQPIYLDNHATTRVDPRVLESVMPYFMLDYGNPASRQHVFGQRAAGAVAEARDQVACLIGARSREIVFTSGATESNNLAIKGAAMALRPRGSHVVTVATEHNAVLDPFRRLEGLGYLITILPVDRYGQVAPDHVAEAITSQTILVSVMLANNEIGTLQPIGAIGAICKQRGVLLHTDAAQAVGRVPIDVDDLGVDLMSFSSHKMYGPKGVGALFVRRHKPMVHLEPLLDGGGHERGLRSGTLPVPQIVGFGTACSIAAAEMREEIPRVRLLRDRMQTGLAAGVATRFSAGNGDLGGEMDLGGDIRFNGHPESRLPNNLSVCFEGIEADALMCRLPEIALSSGAACTSASEQPSHVLRAIGLPDRLARATIRIGLGRFNTEEEVDYVIDRMTKAVETLRAADYVSSTQ